MLFAIQVSNPRTINPNTQIIYDLSHAIQSIFPMNTEDAFMRWNRIPICMNYKYDISVIIDSLLPMLDTLLSANSGQQTVDFASDTFLSTWFLEWNGGRINIESKWFSITGRYEKVLNERSKLNISRHEFLDEWRKLLTKINDSISMYELQIESKEEIALLNHVLSRLGDTSSEVRGQPNAFYS